MGDSKVDLHATPNGRKPQCQPISVIKQIAQICLFGLTSAGIWSLLFTTNSLFKNPDAYTPSCGGGISPPYLSACSNFKTTNIIMTVGDIADVLLFILWFLMLAKPKWGQKHLGGMVIIVIIFQIVVWGMCIQVVGTSSWNDPVTCCILDSGVSLYYQIHYLISWVRIGAGALSLVINIIRCTGKIMDPTAAQAGHNQPQRSITYRVMRTLTRRDLNQPQSV